MRGHRDLQAVAGLSLACAALALLLPLSGLALVFATPLALLLPGYAITAATFAQRKLLWPQLLLLTVALSLATLVLGGLLLNYLPGGIRGISWALLLLLVVLNGCRIAALRRRGSPGPRWPRPRLGGLEAGLLLGAVAATIAALTLASATVPAGKAVGFTQLWVLPQAGSAGSEVQVGVKSEEQGPVDYDLRVRLGKLRPEVVKRSFQLEPGEAQVTRLGIPAGASEAKIPVVATLLRHNQPSSVYRRVRGWLVAPKGR